MAADFYRSSHGNYWLVDRKSLASARTLDLRYASPQELAFIAIWSANAIHKLAKRLSLRQQVTATAIIYLRRFYLKNSYCETDVPLVAAACVYVAAKAEETAIHIKVVVAEARATFNEYGITNFPSDSTKLAEMEFYLIEDLEFHLIVYHPYRSLVHMTGRDSGPVAIRESMLEMEDNQLQVAWLLLNDTYRTELCLLYPPHMMAIAAIYLSSSLVTRPPRGGTAAGSQNAAASGQGSKAETATSTTSSSSASTPTATGPNAPPQLQTTTAPNPLHHSLPPKPMASLAPTTAPLPPSQTAAAPAAAPLSAGNASANARGKMDLITFLASLDVQLPIVLEVVQEMLSLYSLWTSYNDPAGASAASATGHGGTASASASGSPGGPPSPSLSGGPDSPSVNSLFSNMPGERGRAADAASASVSATGGSSAGSTSGTGNRATAVTAAWLAGTSGAGERPQGKGNASGSMAPTLGDERAIGILARMRANREMDLAHPAHGGQAQQAPTAATSLAKS